MSFTPYSFRPRIPAAVVLLATVAMSTTHIEAGTPLALNTARVTIDGNSNLHPYTATTTAVRLATVRIGDAVAGPDFWTNVVKPGALEALEISVAAATLSSPKDGLDKNMHKALKVPQHPEITFKLGRLEPGSAAGSFRGIGTLRVAGVEKEVALDLTTQLQDGAMTVKGETTLLMPDFGIAPPRAMLGMLKTDPKVKVTFEAVLGISQT